MRQTDGRQLLSVNKSSQFLPTPQASCLDPFVPMHFSSYFLLLCMLPWRSFNFYPFLSFPFVKQLMPFSYPFLLFLSNPHVMWGFFQDSSFWGSSWPPLNSIRAQVNIHQALSFGTLEIRENKWATLKTAVKLPKIPMPCIWRKDTLNKILSSW